MPQSPSINPLIPRFNQLKWKMAGAGILVGLTSGLLVVLYRLGIERGTDAARWIYSQIRVTPWLLAPWFVAAVAAAALIAWMIAKEPMASGSGIPQTNGVVICGLHMRWQTILPVRFVGGLFGALFGLSLGREGPSIQIGASGAQFLSHRLRGKRREDVQEHYLVTAGAAAGLSAAFSAPLSGMMFALEGVHRSFSPAILMGATAASLTADFVSKYCFGLRPVLDFGDIGQLSLDEYVWLIPLGVIAGLVGSMMNRSLLGFQTLYARVPLKFRPLIAIMLALPVGIWLPDVLGGGSNLISMAEHARVGLGMLCLLFVVKVLFTSTSFGSGSPGGIFMPILAVGALAGSICGESLHQWVGLPSEVVAIFAVCVMTGTLAASVKTPITSILLAVEMSGTLTHMLPVAAVAFIALLVSDVLRTKPIYGELLERYMRAQGEGMKIPGHVGSGVMELPLEMGAIADGQRVRDVAWPSGCLIIGLRRGESEIVPRGDTLLRAGDYLVVLFSGEEEREVRPAMRRLCDAPLT
ncbi:ClC family H(+)/Cl(-) exchange transporter [Bifidobacterium pseudocatenulatum]|uniref:ClC family H(+)/Cl(-) exchange transporter n=1 Tax=Bifidobacterium pseudocatenulatum TaxID=28026 RepID=UPI001E48DA10|nr:ClC family H(+)/Cl(-) exchange transporter [Bifidobacterium pseudocatenulatum]MDB6510658.1 ClC family H(+)/Cl(-) exchange transporter [Bifidobacterium pseudocatenulatum]MDB6515403.1 ClC family H(+)/Cl(-) exchange transporter [Bifidobacterium pseudocatenulatum]